MKIDGLVGAFSMDEIREEQFANAVRGGKPATIQGDKEIPLELADGKYGKAVDMGRMFSKMLSKSWSNEEQKQLMLDQMIENQPRDRFNPTNPLFNDHLINVLVCE